jgi:hypothetical protein
LCLTTTGTLYSLISRNPGENVTQQYKILKDEYTKPEYDWSRMGLELDTSIKMNKPTKLTKTSNLTKSAKSADSPYHGENQPVEEDGDNQPGGGNIQSVRNVKEENLEPLKNGNLGQLNGNSGPENQGMCNRITRCLT